MASPALHIGLGKYPVAYELNHFNDFSGSTYRPTIKFLSTEEVAALLTFVVSSEWNDHHPIGNLIASVLTDTVKGIRSRRFGSSPVRA